MKHFLIKSGFTTVLIFISISTYSQNWLLGGNIAGGSNGTNISNYFGTSFPNNTSIRIGTFGQERMRINANTGINAAYLGNPGLFAFSAVNYPGCCYV